MRILIIAHHFPPYDHIASARLGKTAKYLELFGHGVRVVAARDTLTPFARMPLEIPADHVTYTPWLNGIFKADLALNRLAQRIGGTQVRNPADWRSDGRAESGRSRRLVDAAKSVRDMLRTVLYFPDAQIGWYPFGVRAARRLLETWRPDLIFASAGPPTALLIADTLSREYGIPWVAEFRDLWVENHRYQHPGWRKKMESRLERRVVSSASGLVTVSEPLADVLRKKYNVGVEIVYNGFDPGDHLYGTPGSPEPWLEIRYTGWIYPQQSLGPLFQALLDMGKEARGVRVSFYGSDMSLVTRLARQYCIEELVSVHPTVSFMESLQLQSGADVLLYLSWNDPSQTGIFSGKLLQYFGARRPILAVGNTDNAPATVIREHRLGFASADCAEIAGQISTWISEKRKAKRIAMVPSDRAAEFSRENQTRRLEAFLSRTVVAAARADGELY